MKNIIKQIKSWYWLFNGRCYHCGSKRIWVYSMYKSQCVECKKILG